MAEAKAVINLIVSYYSIVSLEGIQSFTNLEVLKSRGNFVETVDLSQNPNLIWLHLSTNPLNRIDVSQNTNLELLWVYNNALTTLDVSQNPNLTSLRCYSNNLLNLNISNGNNETLSNFLAYENPNLTCIQVDDVEFANAQTDWQIDSLAEYSKECVLGMEDINERYFTIYPNPTKNVLNIDNQGQDLEIIKIINLQGIIVMEVDSINSIDVSSLTSGLYFVQIYYEENRITKKFIKQ